MARLKITHTHTHTHTHTYDRFEVYTALISRIKVFWFVTVSVRVINS